MMFQLFIFREIIMRISAQNAKSQRRIVMFLQQIRLLKPGEKVISRNNEGCEKENGANFFALSTCAYHIYIKRIYK